MFVSIDEHRWTHYTICSQRMILLKTLSHKPSFNLFQFFAVICWAFPYLFFVSENTKNFHFCFSALLTFLAQTLSIEKTQKLPSKQQLKTQTKKVFCKYKKKASENEKRLCANLCLSFYSTYWMPVNNIENENEKNFLHIKFL